MEFFNIDTIVEDTLKTIVDAEVTYSQAMDIANRLMTRIGELKLKLDEVIVPDTEN